MVASVTRGEFSSAEPAVAFVYKNSTNFQDAYRLDWQMWFAALGHYRENPWCVRFLVRLLEGSPEVLALLDRNPFPDKPPRYIRAVLYQYHFTDATIRSREGTWWRREPIGLYGPVLSLEPDAGLELRADG